jgi:hypothetical protein
MTWLAYRRALVAEARCEAGLWGPLVLYAELTVVILRAIAGKPCVDLSVREW